MSSALQWMVLRNNSCFLLKGGHGQTLTKVSINYFKTLNRQSTHRRLFVYFVFEDLAVYNLKRKKLVDEIQ